MGNESRPVWLIEAGVYGSEIRPVVEEIGRQGMVVEVVPHGVVRKGGSVAAGGVTLGEGACVIGYGRYGFARDIQLHQKWKPGAWCSAENLACTAYYAYFGKYLLNEKYLILPGVEAIRLEAWVFDALGGDEGRVFVRPSGCEKLFVGQQVDRVQYRHSLSPARYDPTTLVVMAPAKEIGREWRLVVAGDEILGGSQYAVEGQRDVVTGIPTEVREFAENMLKEVRWRPDPVFMLDVCESGGELNLVEINGFSCSWMYQCDYATVVGRVSEVAGRGTWQRFTSHRDKAGNGPRKI